MSEIINILMNRDEITYDEAKQLYDETETEILNVIADGCYEEVECILAGNLGLEMDYIHAFI